MNALSRSFFVSAIAAILLACHEGGTSPSQSKAEVSAGTHPFEAFQTAVNPQRAGEIIGLLVPQDSRVIGGNCTNCHQNFISTEGLDHLAAKTKAPYACLNADFNDPRMSKLVLSCLATLGSTDAPIAPKDPGAPLLSDEEIRTALKAKNLGLFLAALNTDQMKTLFDTAGFSDILSNWQQTRAMPRRAAPLSKDDFQTLLNWAMNDFPERDAMLLKNPPRTCEDRSQTYIGANVRTHVQRMSEEGEGWNFVNMARGVKMFACDGTSCFKNKVDGQDIFPKIPGLVNSEAELRELEDLNGAFWLRSSADGRFVAYGDKVVDLLPKLSGQKSHFMKIKADYDPAFSPDNQTFVVQSERVGTKICNQSLLTQADLVTIDFVNQACAESDMDIGLYQAIGNSLDNGDIIALDGIHKTDNGDLEDYTDSPPVFSEQSYMVKSTIRRSESTQFEKISETRIPTPFQGNWTLSASQKLAIGTVSGKNRHGGYHLVLTESDALQKQSPRPDWKDENSALICVEAGEKPMLSFDERFLVYYAYQKFQSPEGMEAYSADLYVIDLLGDGKVQKLTSMAKGQYALFPHFRSDGWLYFTIVDAVNHKRKVVATDAVLKLISP